MSALTQPAYRRALLHGTDAVPIERAVELIGKFGAAILSRVTMPAEARWVGDSAERLAVLLAVKECGIKAVGGRPAGFSWQSVHAPDPGSELAVGTLPGQVRQVFAAFERGTGVAGARVVEVGLAGPMPSTAARQLGSGDLRASLRAAACHGTVDGHVLAAACLWSSLALPGTGELPAGPG